MTMTTGLETQMHLEPPGMFFIYYFSLTLLITFYKLQIDYTYRMGTGSSQGAATKEGQHNDNDNRAQDADKVSFF